MQGTSYNVLYEMLCNFCSIGIQSLFWHCVQFFFLRIEFVSKFNVARKYLDLFTCSEIFFNLNVLCIYIFVYIIYVPCEFCLKHFDDFDIAYLK